MQGGVGWPGRQEFEGSVCGKRDMDGATASSSLLLEGHIGMSSLRKMKVNTVGLWTVGAGQTQIHKGNLV